EELPVPVPLDDPLVAVLSVDDPVVVLPPELTPVFGVVLVPLPVVALPLELVPVVLVVEPEPMAELSVEPLMVPEVPLRVSVVPSVPDAPLPVAPVALPVPVPEPAVPVAVP